MNISYYFVDTNGSGVGLTCSSDDSGPYRGGGLGDIEERLHELALLGLTKRDMAEGVSFELHSNVYK